MTATKKSLLGSMIRRIESIMRQDPRARDNDSILLIHLLQTFDMQLTAEQIKILMYLDVPAIFALRQQIQARGDYLPSAEIAKARHVSAAPAGQIATEILARDIEQAMQLELGSSEPHEPLQDFSKPD